MSQKKVTVIKNEKGKKVNGKPVYYVLIMDEIKKKTYKRATPYTNKAQAEEFGWKLYREGSPSKKIMLFDYLYDFWQSDSDYVVTSRATNPESLPDYYLKTNYANIDNHVKRFIKDMPLDKVTPVMITALKTGLVREGKKNNTINNCLKTINVPINYYYEQQGKPDASPANYVHLFPIKKIPRKILSYEEVDKFFNYSELPYKHYLINLLAAFGGLRISEICGLKYENLKLISIDNFDFYTLQILSQANGRTPKGGIGEVVLPFVLGQKLDAFYLTSTWKRGFIFDGKSTGKCLQKKAVNVVYNDTIIKALNITDDERQERKLTFHSWRHWYITHVEANANKTAMLMARHKSEAMTNHYKETTIETQVGKANLITDIYNQFRLVDSIHADTDDHLNA